MNDIGLQHSFSSTKTNRLTVLGEIITFLKHYKEHTKHSVGKIHFFNIKICGAYSYRCTSAFSATFGSTLRQQHFHLYTYSTISNAVSTVIYPHLLNTYIHGCLSVSRIILYKCQITQGRPWRRTISFTSFKTKFNKNQTDVEPYH
jgi:hypothetical protein